MEEIHIKEKISPKMKSIFFILILIVIGFIVGKIIAVYSTPQLLDMIEGPIFGRPFFNLEDDLKTALIDSFNQIVIILCINIVLLIGLLSVYLRLYQKTRSSYLLGFILFSGLLLFKSLSSLGTLNSVLTEYVREAPSIINILSNNGFGPLGTYLNIFEIIAVCILIYLSTE